MLFADHPLSKMMNSEHVKAREEFVSKYGDWGTMADFILNQDRHAFRKAWQGINKGMYIELKSVSNWIKHHSSRRRSKRLNRSDSMSKSSEISPLPTTIPAKFINSKRLGTNKFQQVVKKVLAKFIEKTQDNKNKLDN